MPIPLNDGFRLAAPRYEDLRQGRLVGGANSAPYTSSSAALTAIPLTRRAEGLIVYVSNGAIVEQWQFVGGIADINLVKIFDSNGISIGSPLRFGKSGEDVTAAENRSFNVNGHLLNIQANGSDCLTIDPVSFQTLFGATDGTGFASFVLNSDVIGNNVQFYISSTDNVNLVQITGDAITQIINLGADNGVEINSAYLLPPIDGSANQVLTTDGAGIVTWQNGGGGGNTIYSADDVLAGNRTVGLNGHWLEFTDDSSQNLIYIDPTVKEISLETGDGTALTILQMTGDSTSDPVFNISTSNGVNTLGIQMDSNANVFNFIGFGNGVHTGTPTFNLQVDASGNVIEGSVSGGTPDLQQVTDVGSNTTNSITVQDNAVSSYSPSHGTSATLFTDNITGYLNLSNSTNSVNVKGTNITANNSIELPNVNNKVLAVSVNGNFADNTGDITISGAQNLQQVTDVGNVTTNKIIISGGTDNSVFRVFNSNGEAIASEIGKGAGALNIDPTNNNISFIFLANGIDPLNILGATIWSDNLTLSRTQQIPDGDGTLALSVNGNFADSSGNITISGATASNGLSIDGGSGDVILGGNLTGDTTINGLSHSLTINSSNVSGFFVANQSLTNGTAITAEADNGIAVDTVSRSQEAIRAISILATTNTVEDVLTVQRFISGGGTPAAGIGVAIKMASQTSSGSASIDNRLISKLTGTTTSTRSSEFSITGLSAGTENILLQISGAGIFTLTQGLQNFVNDAAAAIGGIPVNGLYRTGSLVAIRVT